MHKYQIWDDLSEEFPNACPLIGFIRIIWGAFKKNYTFFIHTRLTESEYLRVMSKNVYFYIVTQRTLMCA